MLDILFFTCVALYFASMILMLVSRVFHKETLRRIAWGGVIAAGSAETIYFIARGIIAHRLPLSNQFEFAVAFSWCIFLIMLVMHYHFHIDWIDVPGTVMTFLMISYAALQPRQVTDLMPALRSAWFGFHIGTAAFSYASFTLAGGAGIRYLMAAKKDADEEKLMEIDYTIYRLEALGLVLLTVTIVTGAIWAEEAWSAFWTWDPKEVWALITWIIYAVYLHLHLARKKNGKMMAVYAVVAVPVVLFTFIGVNTLIPGLHSYGSAVINNLL